MSSSVGDSQNELYSPPQNVYDDNLGESPSSSSQTPHWTTSEGNMRARVYSIGTHHRPRTPIVELEHSEEVESERSIGSESQPQRDKAGPSRATKEKRKNKGEVKIDSRLGKLLDRDSPTGYDIGFWENWVTGPLLEKLKQSYDIPDDIELELVGEDQLVR